MWICLGSVVGGSASMMDVCWYRVEEFHVGWWIRSSNLERVEMRSLVICLVHGHWRRKCMVFRWPVDRSTGTIVGCI